MVSSGLKVSKILLLFLIFGVFIKNGWSAPLESPAEIEELPSWYLSLGETRTLPVQSLIRFSLSGKSIHLAKMPPSLTGDHLLFKAEALGVSEVWIWRAELPVLHLSIQVLTQPKNPLEGALGLLRELSAAKAGERVLIRGQIQSEAELARLRLLEEAFPKQIENQSRLSPELLNLGKSKISMWMEKTALQSKLRIELLGDQLWIRGSAPDDMTRAGWQQHLLSLFPGARFDISTLPDSSRTLYFRIFLLEIKKNAFQQLGLSWPSHLTGVLQIEASSLFWSKAPSIELSLKWLEGRGWAKILSQPELVVRVPGEAELFAGGEIPIQTQSRNGRRAGNWIDWRPYGLILKIKALASTTDQVRLEVSSEMSELDHANGAGTTPAIQMSRVRTQVDARLGEPLFLSGLLQEKSGKSRNGLTFLQNLPVLGPLFSSDDFMNQRSELVAVLLPLDAPPPAPKGFTDHSFPSQDLAPIEKASPKWNDFNEVRKFGLSPQIERRAP